MGALRLYNDVYSEASDQYYGKINCDIHDKRNNKKS